MSETLLELKNIAVYYGGVRALDGVQIKLDEGEIVALMGPNGAGKSTVLKTIFGLTPIHSGEVLWHEKRIKPVTYEVIGLGISFVPQGRQIFSSLTVLENLEMGGYIVRDKKEVKRRISEVLETFPLLKHKLKTKSSMLSGGGQQMLALARGLIVDPKVLLLDEPSLGLAPKIVKEVFQKIKEINERHKTAIMIVEHNIKSVLSIVRRAYILDKGRVAIEGAPESILGSDVLEKVFLGKLE
ncbi:MAG: ABC transporter ATP-binding protein [Patescibacteria group bacterium]|nr:ABC transporter ATP-binding protein [Patescibacteria group bacterium]